MGTGSETGRRLLAFGAVCCAVCGLLLAASAMPMLASESPANDVLTDSDERESQAAEQPSKQDRGLTDRLDGDGTPSGHELESGGERTGADPDDGLATDTPAGALADRAHDSDNPLVKGALYGLAALASLFGGGSAAGTGSMPAADGNPPTDLEGDLAGSDVDGEFGNLLDPADESGSDAEATLEDGSGESGETDADLETETDGGGDTDGSIGGETDTTTDGEADDTSSGDDGSDAETTSDDGATSDEDGSVDGSSDGEGTTDGGSGETTDSGDGDEVGGSSGDGGTEDGTDGSKAGGSADGDSSETATDGAESDTGDTGDSSSGDERSEAGEAEDGDGETASEDGDPSPSDGTVTAALAAIGLLVAGYVFYTHEKTLATLRSIPGRLVSIAVSAVVACSQALERALAALRELRSIAELPDLVLSSLLEILRSAETRIREATAALPLFGDDPEDGPSPDVETHVSAREHVRRAFASVIDASPMYRGRVATATPADVARSASTAGAPDGPVETITDAFRDVEYGDRDPESYLERTTAAHDRLRSALESASDESAESDHAGPSGRGGDE